MNAVIKAAHIENIGTSSHAVRSEGVRLCLKPSVFIRRSSTASRFFHLSPFCGLNGKYKYLRVMISIHQFFIKLVLLRVTEGCSQSQHAVGKKQVNYSVDISRLT